MELIGQDLLELVYQYPAASNRNLAIRSGYIKSTESGTHCADMERFYNALLDARSEAPKQEIQVDRKSPVGKPAGFKVVVHKSGNIVIGAYYTRSLQLKPGDQFKICPGNKNIVLERVN